MEYMSVWFPACVVITACPGHGACPAIWKGKNLKEDAGTYIPDCAIFTSTLSIQ